MIPVSALTTTSFRSAPTVVPRFNGFTSAQFTGPPKPGQARGELLKEVDELVADAVRVGGARRVVLGPVVSRSARRAAPRRSCSCSAS